MITRTQQDWEIALAEANSSLASADVYGPQPGSPYVKQGQDTQSALVLIRNYLQAAWTDIDYRDIPECVACLDRILNDLSH